MKIPRVILSKIRDYLSPNKVVVLYGPRRVGKTTLLKNLKAAIPGKVLWVNGDERRTQEWLSSQSIETLKKYIGDYPYLFIDEAQYVNRIGLNLKLIVDHIPGIKVIATGSSSFDLAHELGEPLVGRKWQFYLFPIAQLELRAHEDQLAVDQNLEDRLIFGSYPEVITTSSQEKKERLLADIVDHYLLKDLFALEQIKQPKKIFDLLTLLAFQIGHEVSISELSSSLHCNFHTVERYLNLLTEVFVLIRVGGFSRNLRKEVSKNARYYFLDNGIRNALINNFNKLDKRDDLGQLWENYIVVERMKKRAYTGLSANVYFWRTYDQKEIDLIEERGGRLFGFEITWQKKKTSRSAKEWLATYKEAAYKVIDRRNYLEFIT